MKKRIIFISALWLVVFISCKKDPPINSDCYEIPPNSPANFICCGWDIEQPQYGYQQPCFNPNNNDEFVFVREDFINRQSNLMKYNMASSELIGLTNKKVLYQPSFSTKGWIAFNSSDKQIWKIKENGDSLTRITHGDENWYPDWSPNGDQFIVRRRVGSKWPNHTFFNLNGTILKEIDSFSFFSPKWSPDSTIIIGTTGGTSIDVLQFYYLSDRILLEIPVSFSEHNWILPYALDWYPDSKRVIWTDKDWGLYITNIYTHKTNKIKQGCDNRYYGFMSVSADGSKIISERTDQRVLDDKTKFVDQYLVIMNADGSGEKRIDIK